MSTSSLTFKAGGTLEETHFYLERSADEQLPQALLRGDFCYVLAPRQMGKSSLRYRVAHRFGTTEGARCATVDLTGIGTSTSQAEDWYFGIVDELARQLGEESLRAAAENFWMEQAKLPIVQRFTRFLREVLLAQITGRIVVFVDEIDAVRALPFSSDDFFAAIRAVYNARSDDPEYKRLSICLLGVAQPRDLIRNEQITPFNIGTRIELMDFERSQLAPLAPGLTQTGADPQSLLDAIYDWTRGHPSMVQTLCADLVPSHEAPQKVQRGQESQHITERVRRLFLLRSQTRNSNLDYAEKCFQRSDTDPLVAKMLGLYARLSRGERIAADGRDPIQGALLLTGMAAPRETNSGTLLQARNRIFATVFDAAWVKARQADRALTEPLHRWLASGRHDDFVLRGEALREAERWADKRIDTTSDEQEFLRACWRVHTTEAQQTARTAQAEREKAQAQADVEKAERERAQAVADAEKAEREKTQARVNAEKAEWERSIALAQSRTRRMAVWFLGLVVTILLIAFGALYREYGQATAAQSRAEKSAADEKNQRQNMERLSASIQARCEKAEEEGKRAKLLSKKPGGLEAVHVGLQAVSSAVGTLSNMPGPVNDGLVSAAQLRNYQLFSLEHENSVNDARFSADGSRVLTTSNDHTARIWDAKTGRHLAMLKGHTDIVDTASFSSDGKRIVTVSRDHTARIWDAKTGTAIATLSGHTDRIATASFSLDGKRIVTASRDHTARVWDAKTGTAIATLSGHTGSVDTASFSFDGQLIVTVSWDHTARIWDAKTGKELAILSGLRDRLDEAAVKTASFSSDGSRVVTLSSNGLVRIWDAKTREHLETLNEHTARVNIANFSPDGIRFVTGSDDRMARIWDAKTGRELVTLSGHTDSVKTASFSSDGKRVVTVSNESVRIWDAETGARVATLKRGEHINTASFSSDGSRVITEKSGSVQIWDAETGDQIATVNGYTTSINTSVNSDGTRVVTTDRTRAWIWDVKTGAQLASLNGHTDSVNTASFSFDGTRVVTASRDRTARIWDVKTGTQMARLSGHTDSVNTASFSFDGTRVVTASDDHTAQIWDAKAGAQIARLSGHTDRVNIASFSFDGTQVVTASRDRTAQIWNAKTGAVISTLTGHTGEISTASFSSDGSRVVTASRDHTARVWDAATGEYLSTLNGHTDSVNTARFSPDGTQVVTASEDSTAGIWDARTGSLLVTLRDHKDRAIAASFSSDGTRVMTASWDRAVRIWDAKTGFLQMTLEGLKAPVTLTSAAFSSDDTQVVMAGSGGQVFIYSTQIEFYVKRACELLRGHREQFHDVANVCKQVGVLPLPLIPT